MNFMDSQGKLCRSDSQVEFAIISGLLFQKQWMIKVVTSDYF